jgi:hypothetical protein
MKDELDDATREAVEWEYLKKKVEGLRGLNR